MEQNEPSYCRPNLTKGSNHRDEIYEINNVQKMKKLRASCQHRQKLLDDIKVHIAKCLLSNKHSVQENNIFHYVPWTCATTKDRSGAPHSHNHTNKYQIESRCCGCRRQSLRYWNMLCRSVRLLSHRRHDDDEEKKKVTTQLPLKPVVAVIVFAIRIMQHSIKFHLISFWYSQT